jgi:hypothetical protein
MWQSMYTATFACVMNAWNASPSPVDYLYSSNSHILNTMVLLALVHFAPLEAMWPKINATKTVEVNIAATAMWLSYD